MNGRKTVLVTGATGGIGRLLVLRLLNDGHRVIAAGRNTGKLAELEERGAVAIQADFRHRQDTERFMGQLPPVDAAVFAAGIGFFRPAGEQSSDEMREMFEVNVLSVMEVTRHLLNSSPGLHLVYVVSMAGKVATPKASVYAATKHALLGYANAVRMETAGKAEVTVVNTGPVDTEFLDLADSTGNYRRSAGRMLLQPDAVAEKIMEVLGRPVREVNMPRILNAGHKLHALLPSLIERAGKRFFNKK
ncbi:SDR family NAD(P)-dependent oxidoreductase [Indiicoccus explosivorum]|uniref:SDR family NAD(P)-dependent oxidoreductase n=1 Tax=Indiicoccus explosivorum TaxID=1917864 RepID=UPI000B4541B6|nr:SDR family NAD(P)-dependent oxidoreductase [Indiicoccus explosivorum]